jgi:hypothetical protein
LEATFYKDEKEIFGFQAKHLEKIEIFYSLLRLVTLEHDDGFFGMAASVNTDDVYELYCRFGLVGDRFEIINSCMSRDFLSFCCTCAEASEDERAGSADQVIAKFPSIPSRRLNGTFASWMECRAIRKCTSTRGFSNDFCLFLC